MQERSTGSPAGGAQAPTLGLEHTSRRMRRHVGTKVAGVLAAALLAFIIQGLARNGAVQWSVVGQYLFSEPVLTGVLWALLITVSAYRVSNSAWRHPGQYAAVVEPSASGGEHNICVVLSVSALAGLARPGLQLLAAVFPFIPGPTPSGLRS